jgi:hypothetical protein
LFKVKVAHFLDIKNDYNPGSRPEKLLFAQNSWFFLRGRTHFRKVNNSREFPGCYTGFLDF